MSQERPVTLKTVAAEAGVSVSAVSYALRGAPNIPAATAERVRAVAARLGYRPNARVGELMAHIRQARPLARAEPLALVYLEGDPASGENPFHRRVEAAARNRAQERGYNLAPFWLSQVRGNARRLAGILGARGISGVLFAPTIEPGRIDLNWPWAEFAMAVIGMAEWSVPLSRAGHHHYEAMRLVLERLAASGARRPVAVIDSLTNERAHRGWQAAWLAYGPADAADRLWLRRGAADTGGLGDWLAKREPDAIVADGGTLAQIVAETGWNGPAGRLVSLSWHPGAGVAGIEQGYDAIAEHAVDLVVTQLQRNERGLASPPHMLLFPGRWREAE